MSPSTSLTDLNPLGLRHRGRLEKNAHASLPALGALQNLSHFVQRETLAPGDDEGDHVEVKGVVAPGLRAIVVPAFPWSQRAVHFQPSRQACPNSSIMTSLVGLNVHGLFSRSIRNIYLGPLLQCEVIAHGALFEFIRP